MTRRRVPFHLPAQVGLDEDNFHLARDCRLRLSAKDGVLLEFLRSLLHSRYRLRLQPIYRQC